MKNHVKVKHLIAAKKVNRKSRIVVNTDPIIKNHIAANTDPIIKNHTVVNADPITRNHAAANTDPIIKSHTEANADPIIRKATASHTAVIDLNVHITTDEVIHAEDAERKNAIIEAKEMLIANGIKGICGSIDVTAN
ncbi:hypothetical protein AB1K80_10910 [Bacillus sp. 179-C3.3 HS]